MCPVSQLIVVNDVEFCDMTQSSACTQNHLWAVNKSMTVFQALPQQEFNLTYIAHTSFCIKFEIILLHQSHLHFA